MFSAANLPEAEGLSILSFVASQKVLPSREEPDVSLSIVNSKALPAIYSRVTCVLLAQSMAARLYTQQ